MWRWPTVQAQKEAGAKIKSKVNAIHAKLVSLAAERGWDPKENNALAEAITDAKKAGVTIDVIERAVKRGAGLDTSEKKVEEIFYEGYLSWGVAIIIRALTDNRNRTAPSMRHIFSGYGGALWETGSVSNYLYDYKGQLILKTPTDFDAFELALLDTEAEDYRNEWEMTTIWTDRTTLANVKKSLEWAGYTFESSSFAYIPKNYSEVTDFDTALKVYSFLEAASEDEDIEAIWNNADISDDLWEKCREKVEASRFRT
jgi:YebC/PmpR family DNA-binding regulatory protein